MLGFNGGLMGVKRDQKRTTPGLWFPNERAIIESADPYFANVSLLLHMDGSNGSTTFTDSSNNALTVTANGNAQISTGQSRFGGASGSFDGTNSWLACPSSYRLSFGTDDFTIELFVYFNALGQAGIYETPAVGASGSRNDGFVLYMTSANKLDLFSVSSNRGASATTFTTATWYHIALVRLAGVASYFIDGVKDATTFTFSTNCTDSTPVIGRFVDTSSSMFNGYMDEVRVTKGVARYTANFTPPPAPFPNG